MSGVWTEFHRSRDAWYSPHVPTLRNMLASWSREQLVDLVERMVDREPTLVAMIDTARPGHSTAFSAEDIDRQIDLAFRPAMGMLSGASFGLALAMEDLAELGLVQLKAGHVANATTILAALSAGIRERYDRIVDDESEVGRVLDECVNGLEACLSEAAKDQRASILRALLDVAVWDCTSGGYGIGERSRDVVVQATTVAERGWLADLTEPTLAQVRSEYSRQKLGRLLVRLRGDGARPSRPVASSEPGGAAETIAGLLRLHRPDEAARALARVRDAAELVHLAALFDEHGYPGAARGVLEAAAERKGPGRSAVLAWLYATSESDADRARWAEELFFEDPRVERWELVRRSICEHRRTQMRRKLLADGRHLLLVEILLAEGKAREAMVKFRRVKERSPEALRAAQRIAEGLVARRPRDAAELWGEVAEVLLTRDSPEDHEQARELTRRGSAVLLEAGHPVLAKRYVERFERKVTRAR